MTTLDRVLLANDNMLENFPIIFEQDEDGSLLLRLTITGNNFNDGTIPGPLIHGIDQFHIAVRRIHALLVKGTDDLRGFVPSIQLQCRAVTNYRPSSTDRSLAFTQKKQLYELFLKLGFKVFGLTSVEVHILSKRSLCIIVGALLIYALSPAISGVYQSYTDLEKQRVIEQAQTTRTQIHEEEETKRERIRAETLIKIAKQIALNDSDTKEVQQFLATACADPQQAKLLEKGVSRAQEGLRALIKGCQGAESLQIGDLELTQKDMANIRNQWPRNN